MRHRPLYLIAAEIVNDWDPIYFAAAPYVDAMVELDQIGDMFYHDSAREIVAKFLGNAKTWRGETARRIKAELRAL